MNSTGFTDTLQLSEFREWSKIEILYREKAVSIDENFKYRKANISLLDNIFKFTHYPLFIFKRSMVFISQDGNLRDKNIFHFYQGRVRRMLNALLG